MFYPTDDIDEIMPDALVSLIDEKNNSGYKTRVGYFTRRSKSLKELVEMKRQAKKLEMKPVQHDYKCIKGTIPENILMHASFCYAYKHGEITLNGLDNSTAKL